MKINCSKDEFARLVIMCNRTYRESREKCKENCIFFGCNFCDAHVTGNCSPLVNMCEIVEENEAEVLSADFEMNYCPICGRKLI